MIDGDGEKLRAALFQLLRPARGQDQKRGRIRGRRRPRARSPRRFSRSANSAFASASRSARFSSGHAFVPARRFASRLRGARIFAHDFAERGASRFLLTQSRERLAEPKQRLGRLAVVSYLVETARNDSAASRYAAAGTGSRPASIAPPAPAGRSDIGAGSAERVLGERVVLVQHIAIGEIVLVLRVAPGGRVACRAPVAPVALGLRGGGGGNSPAPGAAPPGCVVASVERSSGAPAVRGGGLPPASAPEAARGAAAAHSRGCLSRARAARLAHWD